MDEKRIPFRHPLFVDNFGLYITAQQMHHYLMRPDGEENFNGGSRDFFKYLNYCRIYNLLYDASEDDPEQAQMYWDEDLNAIAFKYKKQGEIDTYLKSLKKKNAFLGDDSETGPSFFRGGLDEELS